MKYNPINYKPLEFIDGLEQQKHLVTIYDDPEFGKITQYGFIKKGLTKQLKCVCLTKENPSSVYDDMNENGIDVDYYVKNSLLEVYCQPDITKEPAGLLNAFKKILKETFAEHKYPCFFVGRMINDISTQKGIQAELQIENYAHSNFRYLNLTILCTYNVNEIEKGNRPSWLKQVLKKHHSVIFSTVPEDSVCFDSNLIS